ncbi:MAG: hypothetical protein B6D54_04175 [Epsilonproteobacteria bacterium 4484_65]|nr:MAG: hypothetical protein B6D54_04175 [Epsilonproteobacteria bacterium 4484_65]
MFNSYIKSFKIIVFLFVLLGAFSKATPFDISKTTEQLILDHSSVYFDKDNLTLQEIIDQKLFTAYHHPYINRGVSSETIWITITLTNNSMSHVDKILVLSSTLVEYVALYNDVSHAPILKGVVHIDDEHTTLFPYFHINLKPKTSKQYYLKIKSAINPIDFGLWIYDEKHYTSQDRVQQFINTLLIGMVLALMILRSHFLSSPLHFLVCISSKQKRYLNSINGISYLYLSHSLK